MFGHFVYGLRLGHSPFAIIAVATAVVASMTCFAAVVRTREQAITVGLAVSFVLAWLEGLFWPLYDLTRPMQEITRVLMTTWSMSAVQGVMLRDRGLAGVSTELLMLIAYGLAAILIAVQLFGYGNGERA